MKQLYKILISGILVAFFVIAGSGYNIVHYCCDECEEHGIVQVATHSCEEFHQNENHAACSGHHQKHFTENDHKDMACSEVIHMNDGCHLLRLHTDIPSFQNHAISFGADIHKLLICDLHILILPFQSTDLVQDEITYPPPLQQNKTGREILKKASVLLI